MLDSSGTKQTFLYLAREGDTVDSIVVSATAKPDTSPSSNYRKIGAVTTFTDTPQRGNTIDVVKPEAGHLVLAKRINLGPISRILTFTSAESNALIRELQSMSGKINDAAATAVGAAVNYTPFDGAAKPIRGWWKLMQYTDRDELEVSEDLWGEMTLASGVTSGAALTAPQLSLTIFKNALNTGTIWKTTD